MNWADGFWDLYRIPALRAGEKAAKISKDLGECYDVVEAEV